MESHTLAACLERLTSGGHVARQDTRYDVKDGHRLTFYIGQPGQAMVVKDVSAIELDDGLAVLEKTESNDSSTLLVAAADVHAIRLHPPKEEDERRAGFA